MKSSSCVSGSSLRLVSESSSCVSGSSSGSFVVSGSFRISVSARFLSISGSRLPPFGFFHLVFDGKQRSLFFGGGRWVVSFAQISAIGVGLSTGVCLPMRRPVIDSGGLQLCSLFLPKRRLAIVY